ncbi:dihydrodipicolinate synthase family protein [Bifidobacterium tissieri]|uniref:Dihydrodipicolinate synthase family protein n=1 Tax=Bifidobacterium tissieri TaxID=1630162 RepID=A0A5M9ZRA0_9BIFI|nr:dihydrodipicolinate synthase family protein [Bifidobacterium tissieri]KAA8827863.1 dihydrodipicolinate synthase family protein [Bifidobacterium tissieri]KAA8829985.1 dihydrodipicolinate synthase family protein [Bifidobacterium tissieri]
MAKPINVSSFQGIFVPILMPVENERDGAIDIPRLRKQVSYVIEHGVDGILAFGSNSEFYMFSDDEMLEATQAIIDEAAGRVPVMFGVGHIRTSQCVELARRAAELDIDAISVLQPMFITPTQPALYHHFKAIADAVPDTAVLIYNNPGLAGYPISLDTIVFLAHDVENIVGIKDSSGNITNLQELVRRTSDIDFKVFAGKDTIVYAGFCCGADGAVCSTANIYPELICGVYDKFVAGDLEGSRKDQFTLNPIRLSQDAASFPAATKDMANLLGMEVGPSVLPTEPTGGAALEGMKAAMREAGYIE